MRDVVVVLGARIGVWNGNGKMAPAFHTEMRARAAGFAWKEKMAKGFILSGGYNIGVRYDLDRSTPVFGNPNSPKKPDFSKRAQQKARCYRSEASVMAEIMIRDYGVPPEVLILEEESRTTAENAQNTLRILGRLNVKKFTILTNLFHIQRAVKEFVFTQRPIAMLPSTLLAESLYVKEDRRHLSLVLDYYSGSLGGMTWNQGEMRRWLLKNGDVPTPHVPVVSLNKLKIAAQL